MKIMFLLLLLILVALSMIDPFQIINALGGKQSNARKDVALQSGHFENGKFKNLVPTNITTPGSLWKTVSLQFFGKEKRVPDQAIPTVAVRRKDFEKLDPNRVSAVWIGHSTVLIELDGYRILSDPIWSERAAPSQLFGPKRFFAPPMSIDNLPDLDAVVISHDHYDHLDMNTILALSKRNTKFIVPLGAGAHLEAWKVPKQKIIELNWDETFRFRDLTITATPARHYSGRYLLDGDRTLWSSFVIIGPRHRVFYSGDSGYFDGFKRIGQKYGPFDLTFIKVGAYGPTWPDIQMTPEEAVQTHQDVKGNLFLPVHWGTFNLAFHDWKEPAIRFMKAARLARVRFTIPKPGEIANLEGPDYVDDWWR
jgi:L-ascorbate metabolism protein UlaG (beta-lactamase superfamily)